MQRSIYKQTVRSRMPKLLGPTGVRRFRSTPNCSSNTSLSFPSSLGDVPFTIPTGSWLNQDIGNTPLTCLGHKLYAKLEGHNPGGSIKDRTLCSIIFAMLRSGKLQRKGGTLCLVTSGSAGYSLLKLQEELKKVPELAINVVVVLPKPYAKKPIPQDILAYPNVKVYDCQPEQLATELNKLKDKGALVSTSSVMLLDGVFMDVLSETKALAAANGWEMLDQHYDASSMEGHRSTARELLEQVPGLTDVVCATGTGATAAGLKEHLPDHIKVHSRPAVSGSIDGLSDVNRYKNFCQTSQLEGYDLCTFDSNVAQKEMSNLLDDFAIRAGPSSGATYNLAKEVRDKNPNAKVAFLCADGKKIYGAAQQEVDLSKRKWDRRPMRISGPLLQRGTLELQVGSPGNGFMKSPTGQSRSRMPHGFTRRFSTTPSEVPFLDSVIVGGGPVGASAAWFLAEHEKGEDKKIMLVHDPQNKGAHEDWSRLARLSFDGPMEEMVLSRHAVSLLDMAEEIRSYQSGAPVVPLRPGMLFLASPGTNLALACAHGEENFDDPDFIRRDVTELEELYPGNTFNLPKETLCWSHPVGLCVSPLELASVGRGVATGYGVDVRTGRASVDMAPESAGPNVLRVTIVDETGSTQQFDTRNCFLFAGAQGKKIVADAVARGNKQLMVPEFDDTYITAISTVRYKHRNHPASPKEGSGHVPPPITLGQLDVPDLCPHQANFSVVAEEYGDVLKTRLSGAAGAETIPTVADLHTISEERDEEMRRTYGHFFGSLFPYLETEVPLDFNRCVTYRNHNSIFSGTSLLQKVVGDPADASTPTASLMTTPGCFGVGVKFGPALGQAAAAHTYGDSLEEGMDVYVSGDESLKIKDVNKIERAW